MAAHEDLSCALSAGERQCVWPTTLTLTVSEGGADFELSGTLDREGEVPLPGSSGMFPLEVRTKGSGSVPVILRGGAPVVRLASGPFSLSGRFSWDEVPKSLQLPPAVALVQLTLRGEVLSAPLISAQGELWLKEVAQTERAQEDSASVRVFRRLEDGVPFRVHTRVVLRVSGKARELTLGSFLPAGSTLIDIDSPLETRVAADGTIRVRARPGEYPLTFESVYATPPREIGPVSGTLAEWPAEEVWVWAPQEDFRSVYVTGGTLIDPSRTDLPGEWSGLSTYLMLAAEHLSFETARRGEQEQGADALSLVRTAWLSLNGDGLSVRDEINGQLRSGVPGTARLNAAPELELGRASLQGSDQLITEDPESRRRGIEIRTPIVSLVAESRLAASLGDLPVVAWDTPMQNVRFILNLPPGWDLFHAAGADAVSRSWVSSWTLLEIFLVLLAGGATWRLLGFIPGLIALAALVLLHEQPGSPQLIYFHLLAGFGLLRFLPESGFRRFVRFHYRATLILFGVLVATFSFHHLIQAIFPSVLPPGQNLYGFLAPFFFLVESTFSGWITLTLLLWGAQLFFRGQIVSGFLYGIGAFSLATVVGLSASFTGVGGDTYGGGSGPYVSSRVMELGRQYKEEMTDGLISSEAPSAAPKTSRKQLVAFDKNAIVQTGPGLPAWQWRSVELVWSGKVEPDYRVSLMVVGPLLHGALSCGRVMLLVMILLLLLRGSAGLWRGGASASVAAVCLVLALLSGGASPAVVVAEELPTEWHLRQLEERLLQDVCREQCLTVGAVSLQIAGSSLRGEAKVSSRGPGAVALPGPFAQLEVASVQLNGAPASLRRDGSGMLWVRVPDGLHLLTFTGSLRGSEVVTLQFAVNPEHVTVSAPGWEVDGLSPTGAIQGSLQFTRAVRGGTAEDKSVDSAGEAASWFSIQRDFGLGLPWSVTTTVTRSGNIERPESLRIKLLEGESIVSSGVKVEGQSAQILFQRGTTEVVWESVLAEREKIALLAGQEPRTTETWVLRCSGLWQCRGEGLAPERSVLEGESGWLWRPFPGESVQVSVRRPQGAPGQSSTVDSVRYSVRPGVRSLEGTVALSVRASQGGFQELKLPDGATLSRVLVNGQDETTRYQGSNLSLPVKPGANGLDISFNYPREPGLVLAVPAVQLKGRAANTHVIVSPPEERWVLLATGPGLGPVALFWGKLLAILLLALLLGRVACGPFATKQWLLLGLGLATLPVPLLLVPVLWAWLMQRRAVAPPSTRFLFNAGQVGLAVLTLLMLMVLYRAVSTGLIMSPDMMILGYQSSAMELAWYLDYVENILPTPVLITVPLWVWRVVMLAWSTWLVFSLLTWLAWAYTSIGVGGLWRSSEARPSSSEPASP